MVFFNYSTMQMTAKVVYYGPGLCGKTTNLQYIYGHTSNDSRGEMVSLETESDRTLFFDLLPIDVGTIGGFNTRVQLYTVPGQVFYNTTRKLVLKGVDGVVFVADSQKPMLKANAESLKNLEENFAEMGLTFDSLPIVLQYNKRDLPDIVAVDELNRVLNQRGWPYFEASAVTGTGVFDTLKGISKLTLISLKKRLTKTDTPVRPSAPRPTAGISSPAATGASSRPPIAATAPGSAASPVSASAPAAATAASSTRTASRPVAGGNAAPKRPVADKDGPRIRPGKLDVLAELERLRKQTLAPAPPRSAFAVPAPAKPISQTLSRPAVPAPSLNGKGEIHRSVELTLKRTQFQRARRFLLNLRVEDSDREVVDAIRDLPIEITDPADLEKVLLHLNVALRSKD